MRRASGDDLPGLRALCMASEGPGDYVLHYLEWEVANNYLHVALDGLRIVGMAVYRSCIDGAGWLGMARTHPSYRRQGVNRVIVDSFVRLARRKGARSIRLWTGAGNALGKATFRALGFREVGRFTRVWAPPTHRPLKSRPARLTNELWRRVRTSNIVQSGHGYVPHGWEFVPATRATIRAIAAARALRSWGSNALAVPDTPRPTVEDAVLQLTMLAGRPASLLAEGRRIAAVDARPGVGAYVPHTPSMLRTAKQCGFRVVSWGREAILCELPVRRADA